MKTNKTILLQKVDFCGKNRYIVSISRNTKRKRRWKTQNYTFAITAEQKTQNQQLNTISTNLKMMCAYALNVKASHMYKHKFHSLRLETNMSATFDVKTVLALSITVDRVQGFIKSGHGYWDHDNEVRVEDNKTVVKHYLEKGVLPSDEDIAQANDMIEFFSDVVVEKKMLGQANSFEETVGKVIAQTETDAFGISILASIPNSRRIQAKRDKLEDFYDDMRGKSEFVGDVKKRSSFTVRVVDVKYLSKYNIHLVTSVTKDENIVTFFWNKDPDIASLIEGKHIKIIATVKDQQTSKFSGCKETVVNRVKIT